MIGGGENDVPIPRQRRIAAPRPLRAISARTHCFPFVFPSRLRGFAPSRLCQLQVKIMPPFRARFNSRYRAIPPRQQSDRAFDTVLYKVIHRRLIANRNRQPQTNPFQTHKTPATRSTLCSRRRIKAIVTGPSPASQLRQRRRPPGHESAWADGPDTQPPARVRDLPREPARSERSREREPPTAARLT